MTNTDKTRQKLVESMRKTKADKGSGSKPKAASPKAAAPKAAAPKKKKTETRRTATKPAARSGRAVGKAWDVAAGYRQAVDDPYQYGRRVWPD